MPPATALWSVPHIGKLVFVREELRNEQREEATEMYTARHIDELEASGQLELHEQVADEQLQAQVQAAAAEIAAALLVAVDDA
jgi:hypothetical protein